jgi:hypothetical protein
LSFDQRKSADAINFLRDNHFTGLQIGDHPEKLGSVGAGTRSLLAVDARDVIARRPSAVLDFSLAGEVLLVSADAKVDAGDFHGWRPGWVYPSWLIANSMVKNGKANVS